MYLRILKKDIKRKKTMNVILLIFITLAAMFIASSVNNIISVMTALDNYYESAPDDIFRRHDNCDCVVTYECGRMRQDVWSKKSWEVPETDKSDYKPQVLSREQAKATEAQNMRYKGIDKSGESGIMKMGKTKSPIQKPPDFTKYEINEDYDSVDRIKQILIKDFGLEEKDIQLDGLKNADVLEPFVKQLNKIRKETGFVLPNIKAVDIIEGDLCCISSYKPYENTLYISSKFFNSRKALEDTLKDWSTNKIIPKHAKSIRFLAEHEAAHIRIPDKVFVSDEAKMLHKSFLESKYYVDNDVKISEYFADCVAEYRLRGKNSNAHVLKVIDYLLKEVVL